MAKNKTTFRLGNFFFSALTVGVLLLAIALVLFYSFVFIFPDSDLNPFPPTGIPLTVPAEMTATVDVTLAPVVTMLPTATDAPATATATLQPTSTFVPPTYTATVEEDVPTAVPTKTPTPSYFAYEPQQGSPVALSSEIFYPDLGCNTMIIAGQVFNKDGVPIVQQDMILFGDLEGNDVWVKTRTGDPTLNSIYGPGAYEFRIADAPMGTSGLLSVAMIDQENYLQSAKIQVTTYGECDANLILLNFAEKDD